LFGFLTTDANEVVGAVHPKAMPVILTNRDEIEAWMSAPAEEALTLQHPLSDGGLTIVAQGARKESRSKSPRELAVVLAVVIYGFITRWTFTR
jgi:putative SOS response-associated peptidase YedK